MIATKICSACGQEKSVTAFYKDSGNRCKDCHNKACTDWKKNNPESVKATSRRWYHASEENRRSASDKANEWAKRNRERASLNAFKRSLLENYGLSYAEYERMFNEQGGLCKICKEPSTRKSGRLDVDHCHETGQIRGLLCSPCNTAIGLLRENSELFAAALQYLEDAKLRLDPASEVA